MSDDDARLKEIRSKIDALKSAEDSQNIKQAIKDSENDNMSVGLRAGTELITAIVAGGFIGHLLDQWLETKPLFLIALLVLGVITGFVNVWRLTNNMGHAVGYKNTNDNKETKDTNKE